MMTSFFAKFTTMNVSEFVLSIDGVAVTPGRSMTVNSGACVSRAASKPT